MTTDQPADSEKWTDWLGGPRLSDDPEEHSRRAAALVAALWRRREGALFRLAAKRLDQAVAEAVDDSPVRREAGRFVHTLKELASFVEAASNRKPSVPARPTLLGSLDDLVSLLRPHDEGMALRVSRAAFERIMCASQEKWRDVTPNTADHPNSDPASGLLVAYYNGVRIEAEEKP